MKKLIILFLLLSLSAYSFSQNGEAPLKKGSKQINFGLGLDSSGLPLYGQMDFAVSNDITVSPMVGFTLDGKNSFISFAGYGSYHFNRLLNIPQNWDFYAGVNLGFRLCLSNNTGTSPLIFGMQTGGRYYWNDHWGVHLELGWSVSRYVGRFGLSYKL